MTYEELSVARDATVIHKVYCTRCGIEYYPHELILIHLDLRYIECGTGYVWSCPTSGCRGVVHMSDTGTVVPSIVREEG